MTVWKHLTCECIIQYDERFRWVMTYRTCKIHRKFSGQKLFEEIEILSSLDH